MQKPWVVILAGGEGSRVRAMTRSPEGKPVPKQFCLFRTGASLFRRAVERALALSHEARIVPVVRADHRAWWERDLRGVRPTVLLAHTEMRGTAHAVLAAVVEIARRDPHGVVLILPSDHVMDDEERFQEAAERLCREAADNPDRVLLLGVVPEFPDPEYGWIVPATTIGVGTRRVLAFVEKPDRDLAEELMSRGALLNTFVVAASVRTLLFLFRLCLPDLLAACRGESEETFQRAAPVRAWDFSRDFLAHTTSWQRVLAARACGWCDLGTPERLRRWMSSHKETFVWGAS
jgi:mannose-1-phosphate guanylyltransferase